MKENQTCGDCNHFRSDGKEVEIGRPSQGQCRESCPQVVSVNGVVHQPTGVIGPGGQVQTVPVPVSKIQTMFPPMLASDPGCSKHKAVERNMD